MKETSEKKEKFKNYKPTQIRQFAEIIKE